MTAEVIYESDRSKVILGDAADALPLVGKADMIATDPPYGVKWQSNMRSKKFAKLAGDDGTLDVPALLGVYTRTVLHANKHVYVFGYSPDQLAAPLRLSSTAELVWAKGHMTMGDLSLPWGAAHEPITFGNYTDCNKPSTKMGGLTARLRQGSVLSVPRVGARAVNRHPTEKPVRLMRMLIESSSVMGDVVLDPFAGSGSTLVAALLEGRRAVGVELDPAYAEVTVSRVKDAEKLTEGMEAA